MKSYCDFYVLRSTSSSAYITSRRILSLSTNCHSTSLFFSSCARLDFPLPGMSIGRTTYFFEEGLSSLGGCWWVYDSMHFRIYSMSPSSEVLSTFLKGVSCFLQESLKRSILSLSILMLFCLSALLMKVMRWDLVMSLQSFNCPTHSSIAA